MKNVFSDHPAPAAGRTGKETDGVHTLGQKQGRNILDSSRFQHCVCFFAKDWKPT